MFIKRANKKTTIHIVYVDDVVVIGNDPHEVSSLKLTYLEKLKL